MEDIGLGYKIFTDELEAQGLDQPEMIVLGSSAGATLAGLFCNAPIGTFGEPKLDIIKPSKLVHICGPMTYVPWIDEFSGAIECANNFTSTTYKKNPDIYEKSSLLTHLTEDSPETFFIRASNEHFFPNEQVKEAEVLLKNNNIKVIKKVYTPAEHGFLYEVVNTPQKKAWHDLKNFIGCS